MHKTIATHNKYCDYQNDKSSVRCTVVNR